ncbi:MAG: NAD(P)-dependent oxidoreductase [Gammaproteobacteria bacterium]
MSQYRVALSSDFIKPDGSPAYPMFDLGPLKNNAQIDCQFLKGTGDIDPEEIADYDALILLIHRFTANSVPANRRLAVIARFGVGYDTVDVNACNNAGIALAITPDGVRRPVAVAVLTFILALTGKLFEKDRLTRMGPPGWSKRADYMGIGLVGKTLGILGLGNIGAEIVRITKPLDFKFIADDPYVNPQMARELGVEMVSVEDLFRRSDILSVNCLLNDETRHIVNAQRLALMKPTAYLINTARGPVVDEPALIEVLQERRIAGAGLDVFEQEPSSADNPLFQLDNVIVAPHALCWTGECFAGNGAADIRAVLDVMHGRKPTGIVNKAVLENPAWLAKLENFKTRFGG